jgi:hypothetical protein
MCQHETKHCGRCNTPFECKVGNISQCQCSGIQLTDDAKTFISANYSDCLCRNCLLTIQKENERQPGKSAETSVR